MSTVWLTVGAMAFVTAAIKSSGPIAMGGRDLSPAALQVITLLAPTLLAALVVVETFGSADGDLVLDARVLGLIAAGAAIALRAPLAVIVVAAAATAAGARALGVA
jgi:hypothetical protein